MSKVIAIIPARGGSKRLPKKNIKLLGGKPLISHTIETALLSTSIDYIIVTSDCDDILNVASSYKDVLCLKRPEDLASDTASTVDVILHAIEYAKSFCSDISTLCLLQPTSPLRNSQDIDGAISLYNEQVATSVVSVSECSHPPQWFTKIEPIECFREFAKSLARARSQDLDKYYQLNGAIYLTDLKSFQAEEKFLTKENCFPYVMPQTRSVDIDSELDFKFAELLLKESSLC